MRLRDGKIVRDGFHTTLTDSSAAEKLQIRQGTLATGDLPRPNLFVVGRDRAKLGWFWRHAYAVAQCGRYQGSVINPDTGCPVYVGDERLLASDFGKVRLSEIVGGLADKERELRVKPRRQLYSPLWQADGRRVRRVRRWSSSVAISPTGSITASATKCIN